MTKEQVRARIEKIGIIPSIRVSSPEDAFFAAEAVSSSGIPILEVTMTVPGANEVISELVRKSPDVMVGAGTVRDLETARRCLDAGAQFITSPGIQLDIVQFALKQNVVVFPGAMTPSEVMMAADAGADFVKIFPCGPLGGPTYIKALTYPFPGVRLIAAGGVNQHNAGQFIVAGATAIGIGRHLVEPDAIRRRERDWIRELSRRYFNMVEEARSRKAH